MKVVGFEKKTLKSKKTGNEFNSATVYLEEPCKNGVGMRTESVFTFEDRVPDDLKIGSEVKVLYNRYGSVESIEILD